MSRVIKFRVWDTELNHWVGDIGMKRGNVLVDGTEKGRFCVMQFTGLHDKNGIEIFEGDIINMPRWAYPVEVIFNLGKARFCCQLHGGVNDFIPENSEVIGNRFQNSELLKKST